MKHKGKRRDVSGRVDVLASRLAEAVVRRSGNRLLEVLYGELRPELERQIARHLGPRNRKLKQLRALIREAADAQVQVIDAHKKTGTDAA